MTPAELPPVDACPSLDCDPGSPACLPLAHLDTPEGPVEAYWCRWCGMTWTATFDAYGWVVDRSFGPADTRTAA